MKLAVPHRWIVTGIVLGALAPLANGAQSTGIPQYYAGLTFTGFVGSARSVQAVDTLANGSSQSWLTLTNFNLPSNPFLYIDATSAGTPTRFYRAQAAGAALRVYPGLSISGVVGSTNVVQYDDNGAWTTMDTLVLPSSPVPWVDTSSPQNVRRTYRVLDIGAAPVITSAGSRRAQTGYPMSYQITAVSVPAIMSYGAAGLPLGLSINPSSGLISGTPSSVGTNTVTLSATSPNGTGQASLILKIRTVTRPEMVAIPAGTFTMGSAAEEQGRDADEGPTTQVTLTQGFSISAYEITQAEYRDVIGSNPSGLTGDFSRPVEKVSYDEATLYCALLTSRDRILGAISATQTYRLPTEAEWEYAVRAGATNRFSFGDQDIGLAGYGWYVSNSGDATHPVGEKAPNAWGVYDAHGNVWEWCTDFYGNYPGGSVSNPTGPGSGSTRVLRGGSCLRVSSDCRSASRGSAASNLRYADLGFRVVLTPP